MFKEYQPKKSLIVNATKYEKGMETGYLCGKYISITDCMYEEVICNGCENECIHKVPYILNSDGSKCVIFDTDGYITFRDGRYNYCNKHIFENTYELVMKT